MWVGIKGVGGRFKYLIWCGYLPNILPHGSQTIAHNTPYLYLSMHDSNHYRIATYSVAGMAITTPYYIYTS